MPSWPARHSEEYEDWFKGLTPSQRGAITAAVELLEERGPTLGRPLVDRVKGSKFHNMKELRVSEDGDLRVLFAFDTERRPTLLIGGDKEGRWQRWYEENIPLADKLFAEHLKTLLKGR